MKFLSSEQLSTHKYKTPEGYLVCVDAILARTGKQEYRRNEVFGDSDDDSIIEVDRKAEEVFSPETLASFENKPVTVEHPNENVTSENYNELSVGFVRDVHRGKVNGQDVMLGTLVITDEKTIEEIENGEHTELSCGYDCDIEDEANPQQKHIRGNHVALCEQGRAGIAKIQDSINDGLDMKDKRLIENIMRPYIGHFKEVDLSSFMNDIKRNGFDIELKKIDGWRENRMVPNEQIKDYYFEISKNGKTSHLKTTMYADDRTWKVYETNMYLTDSIKDIDFKYLTQKQKELKEELGLYKKQLGSHKSKGICSYHPRQSNEYTKELNESINEAIKYLDEGMLNENAWKRLSLHIEAWENEDELKPIVEKAKKAVNKFINYIEQYKKETKDTFEAKEFNNMNLNDVNPEWAIFVKEKGKWKVWGGTNNTPQKQKYLDLGYEDVCIVKNGSEEYVKMREKVQDSTTKDVYPKAGESKDEFIARFMKETASEYPDEKQRYAVANSYWEKKDSVKDSKSIDELKGNIRFLLKKAQQYPDNDELNKFAKLYKGILIKPDEWIENHRDMIENDLDEFLSYFKDSINDTFEAKEFNNMNLNDMKEYKIRYRDNYRDIANVETINAKDVYDALRQFGSAVSLRGWGTANIYIISISPNDGNMKLYGNLSDILKKFTKDSIKDSTKSYKVKYKNSVVTVKANSVLDAISKVKDSVASDIYQKIKKACPQVQIHMTSQNGRTELKFSNYPGEGASGFSNDPRTRKRDNWEKLVKSTYEKYSGKSINNSNYDDIYYDKIVIRE